MNTFTPTMIAKKAIMKPNTIKPVIWCGCAFLSLGPEEKGFLRVSIRGKSLDMLRPHGPRRWSLAVAMWPPVFGTIEKTIGMEAPGAIGSRAVTSTRTSRVWSGPT